MYQKSKPPLNRGINVYVMRLKSGEKNTKQQVSGDDPSINVDWFLHTWGFLPNN